MKNLLYFLLCCLVVITNINFEVFSQTQERKKPKIKNFGSSLNRTPQENLNTSKKKKKDKNDDDDETIRIETNLVIVDFLVLTPKGLTVSGLKQEDFIVNEDNQPQVIQTFTLGDDAAVPRSIVLIIDYSGSQIPYIERSVDAAKLLVDKLRPNDLMAIVTDSVELWVDYTSDKKKLKNNLDAIKEGVNGHRMIGKSQQFSALYSVLTEMFDEEDVRPIVIFQTDGDQLTFLKGGIGELLPPSNFRQAVNFSLNDLITTIDKSRASIYTVYPGVRLLGLSPQEKQIRMEKEREIRFKAYGINPNNRPAPSKEQLERAKEMQEKIKQIYPNGVPDPQETLATISKYSGGWMEFLEEPTQADGIYSRILDQLNSRYLIGFSPTNEAKDGKRRTVKVSVKDHPEYIVWGRKTYLAPMSN